MGEDYSPSAIEILNGIMQFHNYKDTSGVIFFKSGLALRIPSFYDFFQEEWVEYKTVTTVSSDPETISKYLEENNGGVVSNGMVTLNLPEVIAMVKEHGDQTIDIINGLQRPSEED